MEFVFKKVKAIAFGVCLLIALTPITVLGQTSNSLKVMSYNMRIASPPTRGWGVTEIDSTANVIKRMKPDLVALQEVDSFTDRSGALDQARELGTLTGMQYFFAKAVERSGGNYGVAILSKLPIISAHTYRIFSPDSVKNEIRAMAVIEVKWQSKPFVFASIHLDHLDDQVRSFQVEQIHRHLKNYAHKPILIGADLNVSSDNVLIYDLERAGYHFLEENKKQPTFPNDEARITLDYLFFNSLFKSKFNTSNFKTFYQENYASDHLPIILTVDNQ